MNISELSEDYNIAADSVAELDVEIKAKRRQLWLIQLWTKFLSKTTVRKGMVTLADQCVVSATNFLTGVIVGRVCTKEMFGLYMLGLSIVLFAMSLQTSLISTPYMVYSPRLKDREHACYTGSTLIHQFGFSVLAIIALAAGGTAISVGFGPADLAPVVWALVVAITFILAREYARRICFANLKMKNALVLDSCIAVIQIGGLILLAYLGILSAGRTFLVVGSVCGLAVMGWFIWNHSNFALRPERIFPDLKRNWSFGKWVFASGLLWALSMNLYPWILAAFHGTASAGVWAACIGVTAIANPILLGMQNLLGPRIAHSYAGGGAVVLRSYAIKAGVLFTLLIAPFCILLLLFGGSLIVILYGNKYAGNGLVISILALNLLVSAVAFSISRALFAMERADVDFYINFAALFVLLTLGLWLVKAFGPLGVACSLLISNTAASTIRYILFNKLVHH